jgi:uncharacterized protein DUF4157
VNGCCDHEPRKRDAPRQRAGTPSSLGRARGASARDARFRFAIDGPCEACTAKARDDYFRRPGQDLGAARAPMESAFWHDFAAVRLHRDGLADAHDARAVTIGDDIHFAAGEARPWPPAAGPLLAHELAHVIQQRGGDPDRAESGAALEREAGAAAVAAVSGRRVRITGSVAGAAALAQRQPKIAPAPPSGNILYVGMNNADPEVKALLGRYSSGSTVSVTVIKATAEEAAASTGGTATFDLTTDKGVDALTTALTSDPAKQKSLSTTFKGRPTEDRDDLAHVAKVYSDTEADGKDRMTRVVLSGHSVGVGVWGMSGSLSFGALVDLASIFPTAANQTKHLIVAGCHTGDEGTILTYYLKAYPSLLTVWAWWDTCPSGVGAAAAITTWAGLTERGQTTIPKQGGGIATWSGGVYQGDPSGKASAADVLTSIRRDDARFQEYFDGTRTDPGPHEGWLSAYYDRVLAAAHRTDITGADHDELVTKSRHALRLRYWKTVAKRYWAKYGGTIARGYGRAAVPDYTNLSRKDTLKAIADFPGVKDAGDADKAAAAALLDALKTLDPARIPDTMVA